MQSPEILLKKLLGCISDEGSPPQLHPFLDDWDMEGLVFLTTNGLVEETNRYASDSSCPSCSRRIKIEGTKKGYFFTCNLCGSSGKLSAGDLKIYDASVQILVSFLGKLFGIKNKPINSANHNEIGVITRDGYDVNVILVTGFLSPKTKAVPYSKTIIIYLDQKPQDERIPAISFEDCIRFKDNKAELDEHLILNAILQTPSNTKPHTQAKLKLLLQEHVKREKTSAGRLKKNDFLTAANKVDIPEQTAEKFWQKHAPASLKKAGRRKKITPPKSPKKS